MYVSKARIVFFCRSPKFGTGGIWKVVEGQIRSLSASYQHSLVSSFREVWAKFFSDRSVNEVFWIHGFSDFVVIKGLLGIVLLRPACVIWQPHAHPFVAHSRPFLARFFFTMFGSLLAKLSDVVVSVSPLERDLLYSLGVSERKLKVVPNFVDDAWDISDDSLELSSDFGDLLQSNFVLVVARDEPNKNLQRVYESTTLLESSGYKVVVVCPNLTHRHSSWFVFDQVDEKQLKSLFRLSSFVVIPSNFEAFSLVGLQAIQSCKPLLCWRGVGLSSFSGSEQFVRIVSEDHIEVEDIRAVASLKRGISTSVVHEFLQQFRFTQYQCLVNTILDKLLET